MMKVGQRLFRWYHLYYLLAAFDLATISFSLQLSHQISEQYKASINQNRQWSKLVKKFAEINRAAADVNIPGNDVFISKDVPKERERLQLAINELNARLTSMEHDIENSDLERFFNMPEQMKKIRHELHQMEGAAVLILNLVEHGRFDEATRRMGYMDREYYEANELLGAVQLTIEEIQNDIFNRQAQDLEHLRSFETVIAGAICIMLVGITAYGQQLAAQISKADQSKEDHIRELELAREQALASEQKFQAIFDQTFQFIGLLEVDGTLLEANKTAVDFSGYRRDELIGRPFWETPWWSHSKHSQEQLKEAIREAAQGRFVRFETTHPSKAGKVIEVDFSLKPLIDEHGKVVLLIPEGRDISERKLAERRVSEFYSTVSHELRTPLTSIQGSLGLIANGMAGEVSDKASMLAGMAFEETERLVRLINDILDLRKIEAGMLDLRLERRNPKELVDRTLQNLANLASQTEIELVSEIASTNLIECDPDRVIQVLTNLVGNAIKFSGNNTRVLVSVESTASNTVLFKIKDEGPGIHEDDVAKLFVKFQQIDQSDVRQMGGSGLGLAISKAIVEQHGGSIGVETAVGKGATFWFELPESISATGQEQSNVG